MNAPRTARERARAELTSEITAAARRQLAEVGAAQLSLRAVARELGMASSAVYRYFSSRDELLTTLITDAYDAVGEALERADGDALARGGTLRERWRAAAHALRGWARAHPHEYALIHGSPVPGYAAPQETIAAASRAYAVLAGIAAEAPPGSGDLSETLAAQVHTIAEAIAPAADPRALARGLVAWTQLYGMVSFELFGQFANSVDPADEFFAYAVETTGDLMGLL
ncbi:TetR/AcrR family transcriptional regulator [Tsukamurella sp. 8F]|uniref:TetR/AcrR family transcriptional regulator n=1 Tax=unclassified Tsukamurella TaxID=2633480 RepID=UPI0023B91DD0|nr:MULTISPECIES: TetR/AcrR family transcriptional regulator [unclassified Tsukamurella]MDF0532154.1 TetR/AcrR family transcriptional regulator [Tsukamurella sp. 8J]MDF0589438.1 TetR/AcrR family transcriptional regulator [Tsukamurella sp. 8F]